MEESIISFMMDAETPHNVGQPAFVEEGKVSKYKWLKSKDGVYAMVQDSETVDIIAPGMYSLFQDNRGGLHAENFELETDELYELPNNHIAELMAEAEDFWIKAPRFAKYKIKHKRGIILEGSGGTGKTSIMNILANELVKRGGLVFSIRNTNELMWYINFMHDNLRIAEPEREVIVLIEDIDKYMDGGGVESTVLNWLEGEDSVNHQLVIATTNYFNELNDLLLRPSRFDKHITVEKPEKAVREAYLIKKGLEVAQAAEWAKDTNDFSIAELKELFVSVVLLDLDYENAKKRINAQAAAVVNNVGKRNAKKKGVGFKFGENKD
jgi:ATP-dependent 26S proteasome regulatory subunit